MECWLTLSIKKIISLLLIVFYFSVSEASENKKTWFEEHEFSPVDEYSEVWTDSNAAYVLLGGMVTSLVLYKTSLKRDIIDKSQGYFQAHKPLGKHGKFGDYMGQWVPNLIYMGGQTIAQYNDYTDQGYYRSALMFKATAYSGFTTLILKHLFSFRRPNNSDNLSFPSGHTTTVFAFASVVGEEHGWKWGTPAYLLAMYTGCSRVNDNMHTFADVFMGATIGTVFGISLSKLGKAEQASHKPQTFFDRSEFTLTELDTDKIKLQWNYNF